MSPSNSTQQHRDNAPAQLRFAVLTVSDSRTLETDSSGRLIVEELSSVGHKLTTHAIVPDEIEDIRNYVQQAIEAEADAIMVTGGTGITQRDRTPEAIEPLLDVALPGFGELFRFLSYEEIGAASMLSRAFAGRIGQTLVFCLPGSTAAVSLAVAKLLKPELPHLVFHARG